VLLPRQRSKLARGNNDDEEHAPTLLARRRVIELSLFAMRQLAVAK
jgi:hypothetical protein